MKRLNTVFMGAMSMGLVVSCASNIKKAELPAGVTPEEAITKTEIMKEQARQAQADVLSYKEFKEGQSYLNEAKEDYKDGDEREEVLENIAYSQAYFKKAISESNKSETEFNNILKARSASVNAGAFNYDKTSEEIKDIDEDLRDDSDNFTRSLTPEKTAYFQKKYLEVEVTSVQKRELGKAEDVLANLRSKNAEDLAPKTYKKAKEDILLSKNIIEKSPRDSSVYRESVTDALKSTILLQDVMAVIAENGSKTPESAALKIVMQDRELGQVESRVAALGSAVMTQADQIAFQKAMDNVRSEFSEEEAEVYQQGDKLLIRLKKMNFPVGKSEIPASSKAILTRINQIIRDLNPAAVEIQGHTDSTGSKSINEKLSDARAKNVATYFEKEGLKADIESEGFGPNKPLADNQTKEGRAMNRRVDIVISTQGSTSSSSAIYSE